jgi:hypothetical protein
MFKEISEERQEDHDKFIDIITKSKESLQNLFQAKNKEESAADSNSTLDGISDVN